MLVCMPYFQYIYTVLFQNAKKLRGTPENLWRHTSVPRHTVWESLNTVVLATPCLAIIFTPLNPLAIRFSLLYMTSVTHFDGRYFK